MKEQTIRNIQDAFSGNSFAKTHEEALLPVIIKDHSSFIRRHLHNVDMALQENKVQNLQLAAKKIDGLVIEPGQTFSFWKTVGKTGRSQGYLQGLVIGRDSFGSGYGGGLCQMANMVHLLVLHSPLTVTELHHHTDALFPDDKRRVPFGTGTSIVNNYLDYRFYNPTDQRFQLHIWVDDKYLNGQLLSTRPCEYSYRLQERNHHFRQEEDGWYRISQVYRIVKEKNNPANVKEELILDNHSRVMYDPALIPADEIRQETKG